jgi:hypothetical protein
MKLGYDLFKSLHFRIFEYSLLSRIRELLIDLGAGVKEDDFALDKVRQNQIKIFSSSDAKNPSQPASIALLFYALRKSPDLISELLKIREKLNCNSRLIILYRSWVVDFVSFIFWYLRPHKTSPRSNILSSHQMILFLKLSGYELIERKMLGFFPDLFFLRALNRIIENIPVLRYLCHSRLIIARPVDEPLSDEQDYSVSVIVPCRNEAGHINEAALRIPEMGSHTEIIFCDDHSTDPTQEEIKKAIVRYKHRDIRFVLGPGICKANNVWAGFEAAKGDILMICDGDLTVPPEELSYFYQALKKGYGEFINGSRMVYPMKKGAMKFSNFLGNKFFAYFFSITANTLVQDTLCGTKVLWKRDYIKIKPWLGSWGVKDLWGDFDLLLSAYKLKLKIIDLPVHYDERSYGESKMVNVFRNGLRMFSTNVYGYIKTR